MRLLAVAAIVLLSGCIDGNEAGNGRENPIADGEWGTEDPPDTREESEPRTIAFGQTSGGLSLPGTIPLSVTPPVNVTDVQFDLYIVVGDSFTTTVNGHGCLTYGTTFTVSPVVYVYGECGDMDAGTYELFLEFLHPVESWSLSFTGQSEVDDPSEEGDPEDSTQQRIQSAA